MASEDTNLLFYESLPKTSDFAAMSDAENYSPLPNDWWIGTSDVKGSTEAVQNGKYKTVNMIGAAVISAQINAHEGAAFPYVFGGDGSSFAVPPSWKDRASRALAAVKLWAHKEFEMELRVGIVPISKVRSAGFDVKVARFQASEGVDYAMFSGGGLNWAELQMKAGNHSIPEAPQGAMPDLTGLSCRWSHMPSKNGVIMSIIVLPKNNVPWSMFTEFVSRVLDRTSRLEANGHPSAKEGPGVSWPPVGATLEAHAQRGQGSLGKARRKALFESFVAWVLIKTGLKIGGFDARRYRRIVGENADYRKFEDGLKMTLDCDSATEADLRSLLEKGVEDGIIQFGVHTQSEAMLTCIVPSILEDNHVHFVDGASGGYTTASQYLKETK
ncbi:MAG: DUF3095 domain-containing protein [Pseudomonadota bacterium]